MPCMDILSRLLSINLPKGKSAFLWGPRKVGKSYWLRHHFANATVIDLLKTDIFSDYASRPYLLRERYSGFPEIRIIIDEIQMVPIY
jgi:predicted AAA+ superfamily ATPase